MDWIHLTRDIVQLASSGEHGNVLSGSIRLLAS
jgi:hypothetical protein